MKIGLCALVLALCSVNAWASPKTPEQWQRELQAAQTAAELAAENTARYQNTYTDIYFELDSLTVQSFERRVANGETLLVYIGRPSCSDCNSLEPIFKNVIHQNHLGGKIWYVNVHFLHQDKEKWAAFKQRYGISGTPTLAKFAHGKQVNKLDFEENGGIGVADLNNWLNQNGLLMNP